MSFEDTITRSIAEHVDGTEVPWIDVEGVRRSGERRRAVVGAVTAVAALAVITTGVALLVRPSDEGVVLQPAGLPALDYEQGTRAWYDERKGEVHLGGAAFDIGMVTGLDTQASATPWGLVWTTGGQGKRLLREDGTVEVLAPAVKDARQIYAAVKYDAGAARIGWLTRDADGASLTVHSADDSEDDLDVEVPCDGEGCAMLSLGGLDHDRVFVRRLDVDQTLVLDLTDVDAGWTTIDGFRVADVRNRVVLGSGTLPADEPLGEGWRFAEAEGVESLLTFDGAHELYWSGVLRSTDGGEPLRLDVPAIKGSVTFVNMDSDGSVLVSLRTNDGNTFFDCEADTGSCVEFDTGPPMDGGFLGNDM